MLLLLPNSWYSYSISSPLGFRLIALCLCSSLTLCPVSLLQSLQLYRTIVNNLYSILNLHCILQVRINIEQINYRPIKRLRTAFGSCGPKDLSPFPVFIHNLNHVSVFHCYSSSVCLALGQAPTYLPQPIPPYCTGVGLSTVFKDCQLMAYHHK